MEQITREVGIKRLSEAYQKVLMTNKKSRPLDPETRNTSKGDPFAVEVVVNEIFDYTEQLEAKLKALQDKELTYCEVETAKLKETNASQAETIEAKDKEVSAYRSDVVVEFSDMVYRERGQSLLVNSKLYVPDMPEGTIVKVIILKEQNDL